MAEQTPINLIKKLRFKLACIQKAQDEIDNEYMKYYQKIKGPKQSIENFKNEIKKIQVTNISVNLETLVEEFAKEWGVDVNNLIVTLQFDEIRSDMPYSFNELLKKYVEPRSWTKQPRAMDVHISCKKDTNKHIIFSMPLTEKEFSSTQRDGRKLIDCLKIDVQDKSWYDYYNTFICDDYKNIIFNFKISDIVKEDGEFTENAEIILRAYERDLQTQNDANI